MKKKLFSVFMLTLMAVSLGGCGFFDTLGGGRYTHLRPPTERVVEEWGVYGFVEKEERRRDDGGGGEFI